MCDGSRFSYTALIRQIKRLCLAQERVIARGFEGMPKEKFFKITCSQIESDRIFKNIHRGNSYISYAHVVSVHL